jgi:hypothetical protein
MPRASTPRFATKASSMVFAACSTASIACARGGQNSERTKAFVSTMGPRRKHCARFHASSAALNFVRVARSASPEGDRARALTAASSSPVVVTTAWLAGTTTSCTSAASTAARVGGSCRQPATTQAPSAH